MGVRGVGGDISYAGGKSWVFFDLISSTCSGSVAQPLATLGIQLGSNISPPSELVFPSSALFLLSLSLSL